MGGEIVIMKYIAFLKEGGNGIHFFADETWLCIRALILAHVCVIKIFCVKKNVSGNLWSMSTDTVE